MGEIKVQKRAYGHNPISQFIQESELRKYRDDGWYLPTEVMPDPEGAPDLEVLELILKDREAELQEAQKVVEQKDRAVRDAVIALKQANRLIDLEREMKAAESRARETAIAVEAGTALLMRGMAEGRPIPARELIALAKNDVQERAIRNEFLGIAYYVGKDESDDDVFALNKDEFLAERKLEEQKAAAAKEAAIRARMAEVQ